jgi:hypothetical protein
VILPGNKGTNAVVKYAALNGELSDQALGSGSHSILYQAVLSAWQD